MTRSNRTLSFVCARPYWTHGSSYLRVFQLAELVAERRQTVRVRELAEIAGDIRDEVLVLNKWCLQPLFLGDVIDRLPVLRRHNICLADPVDLLLADETFAHFDGVIAASLTQAEHLASRISGPVFLIHHHVDTRLPAERREWESARAAYFGELSNTRHAGSLNDLVDFFSVDTSNSSEISWARHLPFYNVHYCLRQRLQIDGFKPATKLFIAASFNAPAVIERHDEEARRLLSSDYPYYVDSTELAEVRAVLHRVGETFGKDEWLHAQRCLSAINCYRQDRVVDSIEAMMHEIG